MDTPRVRNLLHDLRNDIGGIQTTLGLASMSGGISQEVYDGCICSIKRALDRLVEVGSALTADKELVCWVAFSDMLSILEEKTSVTKVTITYHMKCQPSVAIIEEDFRSVVEEIIRNGLKYGATSFHIHISAQSGILKIYIKDNGSGLNTKTQDTMGVGVTGDGTRIVQQLMIGMRGKARWFSDGYTTTVILSFETNECVEDI